MLTFTGERFIPSLRGQISYEHVHRYAIASRFAVGKRVLDIGCGEGYGAALLARSATDVIGIDNAVDAIGHAKRSYYATNLHFAVGSGAEIPIADGAIDLVVSFATIEHIGEHERVLDEMRRVLAPNGTVILSSPNNAVKELYFSELRDLLARRFRHVRILGQRIAALSLVHPLAGAVSDESMWYNGTAERVENGLPTIDAPAYFIAVCSDEPIQIDPASAFIDPGSDLLEIMRDELTSFAGHELPAGRGLAALPPATHAPVVRNGSAGTGIVALPDALVARRLTDATEKVESLRTAANASRRDMLRWRAAAEAAVADLDRERAKSGAAAREAAGLRAQVEAHARAPRPDIAPTPTADDSLETDALRAQTEALSARLAAAEDELRSAREELQRAASDRLVLQDVLTSHSWKMTYPIRRLASLVRG